MLCDFPGVKGYRILGPVAAHLRYSLPRQESVYRRSKHEKRGALAIEG